MSDDLYGLTGHDVDRLRRLLEAYEGGDRLRPADASKGTLPTARIETYQALTSSEITAASVDTTVLTTLTAAINSTATTLSVASVALMPSDGRYFSITIDSEQLLVVTVGTSSVVASRAWNGSTAANHANGANVSQTTTTLGTGTVLLSQAKMISSGDYQIDETAAISQTVYQKTGTSIPTNRRVTLCREPISGILMAVEDSHSRMFIRVSTNNGASPAAYAWTEQYQSSPGTFIDYPTGESGTATSNPAYMMDGSASIQSGTLCEAESRGTYLIAWPLFEPDVDVQISSANLNADGDSQPDSNGLYAVITRPFNATTYTRDNGVAAYATDCAGASAIPPGVLFPGNFLKIVGGLPLYSIRTSMPVLASTPTVCVQDACGQGEVRVAVLSATHTPCCPESPGGGSGSGSGSPNGQKCCPNYTIPNTLQLCPTLNPSNLALWTVGTPVTLTYDTVYGYDMWASPEDANGFHWELFCAGEGMFTLSLFEHGTLMSQVWIYPDGTAGVLHTYTCAPLLMIPYGAIYAGYEFRVMESGCGGGGSTPTVTQDASNICDDATSLTIAGTNFTTPASSNTVLLKDASSNTIAHTVASGSSTSLTLTLTSPPISNLGAMTARVTNANGVSNTVQVRTAVSCGGGGGRGEDVWLDTFTGTNGTTLDSHSPDLSLWCILAPCYSKYNAFVTGEFEIQNDRLVPKSFGAGNISYKWSDFHNPTTGSITLSIHARGNHQTIQFGKEVTGDGFSAPCVALRWNGTNYNLDIQGNGAYSGPTVTLALDTEYTLMVVYDGSTVTASINGVEETYSYTDAGTGQWMLGYNVDSNDVNSIYFDNLEITSP